MRPKVTILRRSSQSGAARTLCLASLATRCWRQRAFDFVKDLSKDFGKDFAKDSYTDFGKDFAKDSGKDSGKDFAKDFTKDSAKD